MIVDCPECASTNVARCWTCEQGLWCKDCGHCSNSDCGLNPGRDQSRPLDLSLVCGLCGTRFKRCRKCRQLGYCPKCDSCSNRLCGTSHLHEYGDSEHRRFIDLFHAFTNPAPPSKKRKLEEQEEKKKNDGGDDPRKRPRLVARSGSGMQRGPSINTLQSPPLDLGIISWNINHFQKADEKKQVLRWLFRRHPWIDVVVLQEINAANVRELEDLASELADEGIALDLGLLIRGASVRSSGPAKPGEPTNSRLKVGGVGYPIRTYAKGEMFQIFANGEWYWMRPNQQEYYPILYRTRSVEVKRSWATYDGSELTAEPLYWAKKNTFPNRRLRLLDTPEARKCLDKKYISKSLRESLESAGVTLSQDQYIEFGRKSNSKGVPRWRFTDEHTGVDYKATVDDGYIEFYALEEVIDVRWRPIMMYELEVGGRSVNVGVVHTTPSGGGKMRRMGEYRQVEPLFQHVQQSGGCWVLAGDYYLDPESRAEDEVDKEDVRASRFGAAVDRYGLKLVISLSATNQSKLAQYNKNNLKDQVVRVIDVGGTEKTIRVVNKRADFLICTSDFKFTCGGLVSPATGMLTVDPNHHALDWWSSISDHGPVAGILCTAMRSSKHRRSLVQQHTGEFEARMERAYQQILAMHRQATLTLSSRVQWLIEWLPEVSERFLARACRFLLLVDAVLADPYLAQFGAERRQFDYFAVAGQAEKATDEDVIDLLSRYRGRSDDFDLMRERGYSDPDKVLMECIDEIVPALNNLAYMIGDIDLTPEDEDYAENNPLQDQFDDF